MGAGREPRRPRPAPPKKLQPERITSVEACQRDAYTLLLYPRDRSSQPIAVPFRCGSWRCDRCAWSVAREDYRRIEAGATSRPDWLYLVLTFDPAHWRSQWDAFAKAGDLWAKRLQRRLERVYGPLEYVQTWEATKSGWPHVNVLVRSDRLMEAVEASGVVERAAESHKGRARVAQFPRAWRRWLGPHVTDAGFGKRLWVERVGDSSGMAAYLAKLCGEFIRAHMKDGDQRPVTAPRGFRRIRSSRGILPPRAKGDGSWSGGLVKKPPDAFLDSLTGEIAPTWLDVEAIELQRARLKLEHVDPRVEITMQRIRDAADSWASRYGLAREPADKSV